MITKTQVLATGVWIFSLLSSESCSPAKFQRTYAGRGYDYGTSVAQLTDGGYAICGGTAPSETLISDPYLVRTDSIGTPLWTRTLETPGTDEAFELVATPDDSVVALARYSPLADDSILDLRLVRFDSAGEPTWDRTYETSPVFRTSLAAMTDGYAMASTFYDAGIPDHNPALVVRVDSEGVERWRRELYGGHWTFAFVVQASDGNLLVIGSTGWDHEQRLHAVKLDDSGNVVWDRTYESEDAVQIAGARAIPDGGLIVVGLAYAGAPSDGNSYAARLDADGTIQWEIRFPPNGGNGLSSADVTSDGGFVLAGDARPHGYQGRLVRLDAAGNELWDQYYGDPIPEHWDSLWSVRATADGGYVSAGLWNWMQLVPDVYLVKTDALGASGPLPR